MARRRESTPARRERLPENACPQCFAYPWLREYVETHSTHRGTCPSCKSRNQPLVGVSELYEPFDNAISCFSPAEDPPLEWGTPIVQLLHDEWEVFSERLWNRDGAGPLLEAIMETGWDDDDGVPLLAASDPYVSKQWSHDTLEDLWEEFSREVKADPTRPLMFRGTEFDEFLSRRISLVAE